MTLESSKFFIAISLPPHATCRCWRCWGMGTAAMGSALAWKIASKLGQVISERLVYIYVYIYIYNVQYCGKLKIKGNPFALCLKVYWSKKILNVVWLFVGFAGLMCFFCSFLKSPQIVSQSWNQRNQQWCQCNVPRVETSCWVDFLRTCQLFYELYYVIPIRSIATDLYLEHQFFFQNFETSS